MCVSNNVGHNVPGLCNIAVTSYMCVSDNVGHNVPGLCNIAR